MDRNSYSSLLILFLMFVGLNIKSQTDTSQTYIAFEPCFTNEIGPFKTKFSPTIEVGRQFNDVFTTGIALGKTNCVNHTMDDIYLEFRPNLNVFQVGKFTNTLTTGAGYVFGPNTSLMLELTTGIEIMYSSEIHFNVFFGNYYYSGFNTNGTEHYSPTFFGFSIFKFFKPTKSKGLLKLK